MVETSGEARDGENTVAFEMPRDSVLLKLLHARRSAGGAQPAVGGDDSRGDVLNNLNGKIRKLERSVAALEALLDVELDPVKFADISGLLADAKAELDACEARYQLIDNSKPFKDPGEAEETALLAAIAKVNQALANTAAVSALLKAVSDLVKAYMAGKT